LTQAAVLAITDGESLLAVDGTGAAGLTAAGLVSLAREVEDGRIHVEPRRRATDASGVGGPAVIAPLVIRERGIGALIAVYEPDHRLRPEDTRVVGEAGALVSAQVELSMVAAQEERLARAELHALRARISPHFIYNSLAAIAGYIHSRPEAARTLLTEFAEFTRYAFRGERTYVTIAEELHYVEKYLRLEQARFGDRLTVRVHVDPEVLHTVVPVLSLQPLVENAVKHGVEARAGKRTVEILAIDRDVDVEIRVVDDGMGMEANEVEAALSGAHGGIGLSNVDRRLRSTFGEDCALEIKSKPAQGTTVVMVVPKFCLGVRAA
jgi:two-component system LytT family sensor kinase